MMKSRQVPAKCAGLLALLLSSACVRVEMTSTPDTVPLGDNVTHEIRVTNPSVCPVSPFSFTLFPLMDEAAQDDLDDFIMGSTNILDLETVCAIAAGDFPQIDPNDPNIVIVPIDVLQSQAEVSPSLTFSTNDLPSNCQGVLVDGTISAISCDVSGLAAGASETTQIVLPTSQLGTFLNVAVSNRLIGGVCDAGDNAGSACNDDDDCDGDCDPGICVDGGTPGIGCEDDIDCSGGTCVNCRANCSVPGVCGGDQPTSCVSDGQCPDDNSNRSCVCGIPVACTTTEVAPQPPPEVPALSLLGIAGLVALLASLGLARLWPRRPSEHGSPS